MQLKKIVKEVDINSFMFSYSVKDILGKGFYEMTADTKKKKFSFLNKKKTIKNIKQPNDKKVQIEINNREFSVKNTEKLTQNIIIEDNNLKNNDEINNTNTENNQEIVENNKSVNNEE